MIFLALTIGSWLIALAWVTRAFQTWRGMPRVPNLLTGDPLREPSGDPSITVVVPARNEQKDVRACLESLLAQDYAGLQILAVDDRSTDATGVVMDELAVANPGRMRVLHVDELPAGWLGKTHAMALAARSTGSEFLLLTDADIFFHPTAIRLALAKLVETKGDHLVLMPTTISKRWDEAALLLFFQVISNFPVRLWKVPDPTTRDAVGIGAFNMVRRTAYEQIGGFEAMRMEIVEDLALGRRIKAAGLGQRAAFGRGLVSLHWAAGLTGLTNVMTKNIFAVFEYNVVILLGACGGLIAQCVWPFVALGVPGLRVTGALTVAAIAAMYGVMHRTSGLSWWNFLLAPLAAMTFVYAMLRSLYYTLRQGGVIWRGTFYPLAELRRNKQPMRRS